jgi:hypothetical protein
MDICKIQPPRQEPEMFCIATYKLLGIRSVIDRSPDIFRDVKEVITHRSEERITRNGDGNDMKD